MAYAPASQAQDDTAPLASGAAAKGQADAKLPITGSFALLSDYRSPYFLRKTATPVEYEEIEALLRELYQANMDHIGERFKEVEA